MSRYSYKKNKLLNLCVNCGKEDDYTISGHTLCFECNEKNNVRAAKYYDANKDNQYAKDKERRKEREEKGICICCGKRKAAKNRKHCEICLARKRQICKKQREKKGMMSRDDYYYMGLCWRCGKAPHLENKKLCGSCYEKTLEACIKGLAKLNEDNSNHKWRRKDDKNE